MRQRRRQLNVDGFLLSSDTIGSIVDRLFLAIVVDSDQLDATRPVEAEVEPTGFTAAGHLSASHRELAGLQLAQIAKVRFNVSAKLIERDDLRRKSNHAGKS